MSRINQKYLEYIPKERQEEIHQSLLKDIYYFYTGMKAEEEVLQKNGDKIDVSKDNLEVREMERK